MAVLLPHAELLLAEQMPATDVVALAMLRQRTHVMVQARPALDVVRVKAQYPKRILVRREPLAAIAKSISAPEIQLLACHQVAEFAQVHETPDHDVVARFQERGVWLNGHSPIWPLPLIFASAEKVKRDALRRPACRRITSTATHALWPR